MRSWLLLTVPPKTRIQATSPRFCSVVTLKMNMAVGSSLLLWNSCPLLALMAGMSAGDGQALMRKSIKRVTPTPRLAAPQMTGNISRLTIPRWIPRSMSSSLRVISSKNFSIRASSPSAACSMRLLCISSALAISAAGMSWISGAPLPFLKTSIFIIIKSMTALKSSPAFTGYWMGVTLSPKYSFSSRMALSKLALLWSSWFMKNTTGLLVLAAWRQAFSVVASTPDCALTVHTAMSAA